jgi:hypothetical protein
MGDKTRLWTDAFLAALAECGILSQAAEAAGVDRATVWRRRQDDAEFAKACDEAVDMAADKLEAEARRRAVEGVEEPVYQGGQLIGTKTVYSDSLLALLLKGRRKRVFAERVETTGADGGPVKTQVLVATGVPSAPLDLADLV